MSDKSIKIVPAYSDTILGIPSAGAFYRYEVGSHCAGSPDHLLAGPHRNLVHPVSAL